MYSTLLTSATRLGKEPPISSAKRASFRRFAFVSRIRRSMSCVVTGAPFSMLAELPITTASSLATRSPLARATSVFSDRSEDVPPVLPPVDEYGATLRWQEQAAHDQVQIARIDPRELWRKSRADILYPAREALRVPWPSPVVAVPARRATLRCGPAAPTLATHLPSVHGPMITQALGFFRSGRPGRRWAPFN